MEEECPTGRAWISKLLAPITTGSWDLGQISSTMESAQSSARRPSRLTYKEAPDMAANLSMLEDIGALHAALKMSTENDKDPWKRTFNKIVFCQFSTKFY